VVSCPPRDTPCASPMAKVVKVEACIISSPCIVCIERDVERETSGCFTTIRKMLNLDEVLETIQAVKCMHG